MQGKHDIYGQERLLKRAEMSLHNPLSERNIRLIRDFEKALFSEGLSAARVKKYLDHLRKVGEWLGNNLDEAEKEDIEELVYKIERSDYSPYTKHDYRVVLKRFYRWLRKSEDYPEEVKWIRTTLKMKDELLPEDLLSEEEVMKLVEACSNPRDKAFIITLYESGARIGELGSMKISDVVFEESYARLMLQGKTGSRRVVVVASLPYLQTWLQNHPLKNSPNAPLWVNLGTVNRFEAMSYPALAKILKAAAERARLKKKVHPHKLRHSRATFLAKKLTEAQMNQLFGWRQGSKMPSTYVHLSGRDVDDAILGVYGLKKAEEERSKLTPRICPRCKATNAYDARFCMKCGLALDVKAAYEMEEARTTADNIMNILMKDEEFRKMLAKKLRQYKISP